MGDLLLVGNDLLLVANDGAGARLGDGAETTLEIGSLVRGTEVSSGEQVEGLLLLIGLVVGPVEEGTGTEGDDGDTAVVPDEMGVVGQRRESLGKSSGEGSGEALDTHDERPHVLGGLGVSILERRHGGEDLGNGDQDVDTSHSPDVDGGLVIGILGVIVSRSLVAVVCQSMSLFVALENLHVVLEHGSPEHSKTTEDETGADLLDGGEVDVVLAQKGVNEQVKDYRLLVSACM